MNTKYLSIGALALALTACGGGGGASSTAAIIDVCEAQLDMPEGLCDCVGEEAKELSATERKFVVASLKQDAQETAKLRSEMAFTELTRAGMFFMTATQSCSLNLPE